MVHLYYTRFKLGAIAVMFRRKYMMLEQLKLRQIYTTVCYFHKTRYHLVELNLANFFKLFQLLVSVIKFKLSVYELKDFSDKVHY